MLKSALSFILSASLFASTFGCGGDDDPVDEIRQTVDCAQLCNRYEECKNSSLDVTACTTACDDGIATESVLDRADACEDCLEDKSCEEAETAGCWNDCPVVNLTD